MAVALNIPNFPKFDLDDYNTISTRWEKYKKRFINLCVALNITDDKQKLALLLNYIGEEAYDIYDNLLVRDSDETLNNAIDIFDKHFNPKKNVEYEVYLFRKLKQNEGETIHQFYVRVKQQANRCDFNTRIEQEIKQQLILSRCNNKLRKYAFKNTELTLQEFLTYANSLEDAEHKADDVDNTNKHEEEVNELRRKLQESSFGKSKTSRRGSSSHTYNKTCFRCGGTFPHTKPCPAEGKTCLNCNKIGHFARCCRSSGVKRRQGKGSVNNMATSESSDSNSECDNTHHLFSLTHEHVLNNSSLKEKLSTCSEDAKSVVVNSISQFNTKVNIEGVTVKALIDTGSSLNILNKQTFDQIKNISGGALKLKKSCIKVITYGASEPSLKINGVISLLVENKRRIITTDFYVIDTSHRNLLNGATAIALNLITMPKKKTPTIATCLPTLKEEIKKIPTRLQPLIKFYTPTLFNGKIGKFTNFRIKLHINEKIPPVAQPERRIPFALREKVQKEIERLEDLDIIEDVSGQPTPWLNPLVVVTKGKNDLRICLDMRGANKAITRTRYPTPN